MDANTDNPSKTGISCCF